jgi:hypothetical protein
MHLFLDPGGTTGWALFDSQGTAKSYDQVTGLDSFSDFLTMTNTETPLKKIWYEPFLIDNNKLFRDQSGKKRESMLNHNEKKGIQDTLEVIGAIKFFTRVNKIPVQTITDVTLDAALKHAGLRMPPKSQHSESHRIVALAYGRSYFIRNGITKIPRRSL